MPPAIPAGILCTYLTSLGFLLPGFDSLLSSALFFPLLLELWLPVSVWSHIMHTLLQVPSKDRVVGSLAVKVQGSCKLLPVDAEE